MRILIVGAGISGLAAARGLQAAGHEVTVLEQAEELRDAGGAITLWGNGVAVLRDLGLAPAEVGTPISGVRLRSAGGRTVLTMSGERLEARLGAPALGVVRGHLLRLLFAGLAEGTVRFGERYARHRQDGRTVHVETGTGTAYETDLLIGADGVWSGVRAALFGPAGPRPTGMATWQGLVPTRIELEGRSLMLVGREGKAGFGSVGDGLTWWFFDAPWPSDAPDESPLDFLRRRFGSWAWPVPDLLAGLTDDDVQVFPNHRHTIPRRWGTGRCLLVGDAVHGMPPFLAQGANQGLEDVSLLLRLLSRGEEQLVRYGPLRHRRARLASLLSTGARLAVGPRTPLPSEPALRLLSATPDPLATAALTTFLRATSNRLHTTGRHPAAPPL